LSVGSRLARRLIVGNHVQFGGEPR
jgi:hypothetical protein